MKKKRILAVSLSLVLAAGAAAGICGGVGAAGRKPVLVVSASELNQGGYYGSGITMEGMVTSDVSQDIYLQDTQTVSRVLVREGDPVRQGDVLLEYDTTQTRLNLEREKLNREQILLNIQGAEQKLKTLKNTKPVSKDPGTDPGMEIPWEDFPEEPEIPEVSEPAQDPERTFQVKLEKNGRGDQDFPVLTIPRGVSLRDYLDSAEEKEWKRFVPSARGYVFGGWYQEPDCIRPYDMDAPVTEDTVLYARWIRQYPAEVLQELTDQAVPYNRPEEGEPEAGTLLNPYRYLAAEGAVVCPSFMNRVKEEAGKALQEDPQAHIYFALEVYEGDSLSGSLKGFWLQDAARLAGREFPENWRGILRGESGTLEEILLTPTEPPVPEPAEPSSVFEKPAGAGASLRTFPPDRGPWLLRRTWIFGAENHQSCRLKQNLRTAAAWGLLPEGGNLYEKKNLQRLFSGRRSGWQICGWDLKQSELKIRSTEKAVEEGAVSGKDQRRCKEGRRSLQSPRGTVPRFSRWPAPRACISVAGSASCCWIRSGRETW